VNLSAQHGDIVLLLGASGSGKSLLMNLLIGKVSPTSESLMISPEASVKLWGQELLNERYPSALEGELGVLFQGLGLLEDLTARQNLNFAHDHSAHPDANDTWQTRLEQLAQDLGLSDHLDRPVSALSGGQRQRVALARLLAYRSRAMLFDEPTSALDPLSSERVVQMIQEAHRRAESELTLIITHDYTSFLPIADQVWVVQPDRTIRVDQPARAPIDYLDLLKQPAASHELLLSDEAWLEHAAQQRDKQLKGKLKATPQRLARLAQPLTHPRRAIWAARYGAHLFKEVVVRGLPFHLIAGLVVGMITTYFTFNTHMGTVALERLVELQGTGEESRELVEVSRFVLPTFFKEMLAGFSAAMYRALIPLFTCVCVAARGGTAATAYLSGMRDPSRHEWDALIAFGVSPRAFFGVQLIITFSVGCVLLSLLSFISASLGSLLTSLWTNPLCDLNLWWGAFIGGLK
jgi:ABC-type lipoprotein export system ATPase subunit/ABC-type transporter Mla maintaining outer membrane lipid asymmetry permease subunit MlaE